MKPRNVILTLFLILLFSGIFLCRKWQEPSRKEALDRRPRRLQYTALADCEMECQQISKAEIEQVLRQGIILLNKSNCFHRPCPTFAMQGAIHGGNSLRVIFEQCTEETRVLTCERLKSNFKCQCPVDVIKEN